MTHFLLTLLLGISLIYQSQITLAQPLSSESGRQDAPAIVIDGLKAFQANGSQAAMSVWLKDSPISDNVTSTGPILLALRDLDTKYGKVTGYEVIKTIAVGTRVRRVYTAIFYERGPVFAYFDCYQRGGGWNIPVFILNPRLSEVLPASMLTGQ
ncbi:hypothetical protein [Spirosoma koreense]